MKQQDGKLTVANKRINLPKVDYPPNIINSGYKDECMNNQYAVLISSEIPELGELDLLRSICRELNGYMEDYKC